MSLTDGRTFTAEDAGQNVVLIDSSYATTAELSVGSTLDIGGTEFSVIGIVTSDSTDASTASDTYIPLDVAQTLSGQAGMVSSVYVQAASSEDITQIQTDIQSALPDATVSTQSDLASSVSGSLSTAGDLVASLGTWLSLLVLAAAFLIATLFTISGVTRRTREFGTLKAIGWTNGSIVRQVAGESVVQGLIGGAAGIVLGLIGVAVVNMIAPTLSGRLRHDDRRGRPRRRLRRRRPRRADRDRHRSGPVAPDHRPRDPARRRPRRPRRPARRIRRRLARRPAPPAAALRSVG